MSNNQGPPSNILPYFVAKFNGRATTVKRDANYQAIIRSLKKLFPEFESVDSQNIIVSTNLLDYGDILVQIAEETWADLVGSVRTVEVTVKTQLEEVCPTLDKLAGTFGGISAVIPATRNANTTIAAENPSSSTDISDQIKAYRGATISSEDQVYSPGYHFSIKLRKASETFLVSRIEPSYHHITNVKYRIMSSYGPPEPLQKLHLDGRLLANDDRVAQSKIEEGTTLDIELSTRQTVLCLNRLNSPTSSPQHIKIDLALNRAREFVALAPLVDREYKGFTQAMSWRVRLKSNGTLWDSSSKTNIDCIYWDGFGKDPAAPFFWSQQPSGPTHLKDWLKSVTVVEPNNSFVFSLSEVEMSMSSILPEIGLRALSNFLRSWTHFAIRVLSSADSEALARLDVNPAPKRSTRIAILYKCLGDSEALVWKESSLTLPVKPAVRSREPEDQGEAFYICEVTWLGVP